MTTRSGPGTGTSGLREAGLTLIELMISMTLGLMVVAAATALLVSAKSVYVAQNDEELIADSGRYALESIARAVRQAAYENWDSAGAPQRAGPIFAPSISGLDASRPKSRTAGIGPPLLKPVNGSDVLAVRFFGADDGAMMNCAGFAVGAPVAPAAADASRGWSIFYVARDAGGTPQLYCKYRGASAWTAQAMVRGVESFQVLYGFDSDDDGLPNRFVSAARIDAMDAGLVLQGKSPRLQALDKNRKTNWKKIVSVKVALLVRSDHRGRSDALNATYDLFGKGYSDLNAANDPGVRITETGMAPAVRNRLRRVFRATIELRNRSSGSAA